MLTSSLHNVANEAREGGVEVFQLTDGLTATLTLKKGGDVVTVVEDTGYIGKLFHRKHVLTIGVEDRKRYHVMEANKTNNIREATTGPKQDGYRAVYPCEIEVHGTTPAGVDHLLTYTKPPLNHRRVILLRRNGLVNLYEVGVISQQGHSRLTFQQTWEKRAYRDDAGNIILPELNRWTTLMSWLNVHKSALGATVPHVETFVAPKPKPSAIDTAKEHKLDDNHGICQFWSLTKQFGGIATNQGLVRVHYTGMPETGSWLELEPGQKVWFSFTESLEEKRTDGHKQIFVAEAKNVQVVD